jgi:thiamine biosynthesis lipoprotein
MVRKPPQELIEVMRRARTYSSLTAGAFDVTVAPLLTLYESRFEVGGAPPSDNEIDAALELVDYRRVSIDEHVIALDDPRMSVTLDGIAKGYVVDRTVRTLVNEGAERVLINAGGDMASGGRGSAKDPWTVAIQDPQDANASLALVRLGGDCIATSGDYIQAFTQDRRFHHIIDPRTGRSPDQVSAVTVVTASAMDADALSTAVMVLGPAEGLELMDRLEDTEGVIVTKPNDQLRTSGLGRLSA